MDSSCLPWVFVHGKRAVVANRVSPARIREFAGTNKGCLRQAGGGPIRLGGESEKVRAGEVVDARRARARVASRVIAWRRMYTCIVWTTSVQ